MTKWSEATENPQTTIQVAIADLIRWTQIDTLTAAEVWNYLVFKFGRIIMVDYIKAELTAYIIIWHNANKYKFDTLAATIGLEYNPIENYDRAETRSSTRTPNLTDTLTHNTTQAQTGTTATATTETDDTSETIDRDTRYTHNSNPSGTETTTTTQGVKPFDGASDFNDREKVIAQRAAGIMENDNDSGTEDMTRDIDRDLSRTETITHGRQDKTTGTETTKTTGTETIAENSRIHGNIGVTTVAQMLQQEREMTANFVLLDIYLTDLVKNFTVGIYENERKF